MVPAKHGVPAAAQCGAARAPACVCALMMQGESVAMVLHMVGAAPVREGTGRIARYELLPLEQLGGRPRVDVLCNLSGIFRDSFQVRC